jgi:hypothetical protein
VDEAGRQIYGDQWSQVCARNCKRVSQERTELLGELTAPELEKLIDGLKKLQRRHEAKVA